MGIGVCQGFRARGFEESHPLNNNNRGNNRRRGRGNNRQQGGQQTNRIDSRARGNAPQLLEKYRKLAHDAHLNGDRVTEEYYLQFADHYFRVIADQRQRQEEARQPNAPRRDDHRQADYGEEYGSYDDPYGEGQAAQNEQRAPRQDREQRGHDQRSHDQRTHDQRGAETAAEPSAPAGNGEEAAAGSSAEAERNPYEPAENPFVRDNRASRGLKQRKPRGPRHEAAEDEAPGHDAPAPAEQGELSGFDADTLPPAIAAKPARKRAEKPAPAADGEGEAVAEEKPRRRRTRKSAAEGDAAAPEAVNG
jgi:hypothetical protein